VTASAEADRAATAAVGQMQHQAARGRGRAAAGHQRSGQEGHANEGNDGDADPGELGAEQDGGQLVDCNPA